VTDFSCFKTDSRSLLPQLSSVVQSGIRTLLWHGDADYICNWLGGQAAANEVSFSGTSSFNNKGLTPYNVNGKQAALYKQVGNFAFMRVFGAGHEVPYYQPALALQVFKQTVFGEPLVST
jgi:carboxypeptidase C (cathepsin A)